MKKLICLLFTLFSLSLISPLFSQDPAGPIADKIDPKAAEVVRKYSDLILKSKNIRFDMIMTIKMKSKGMNQESLTDSEYVIERPNKIFYNIKNGMSPLKVVSDGKNVIMHAPSINRYSIEPAPEDYESMACMEFVSKSSGFPVIDPIVSPKPYEKIMEGITDVKYLGVEKLGDKECHHLNFQKPNFIWDAWFETGDRPFIRKIVPDMKKQIEKTMEMSGTKDMQYNMTVLLDNWSVDSTLPADTFKIAPPADAKKIDPPTKGKQAEKPVPKEEARHSLLGKNAPALKLDLLDGGKVDLAVLKGKKIVVLDFWAVWCPACEITLPIMDEIGTSYAGKDVVFYAVNVGDEKDKTSEFMASLKFKSPVALDKDTETAKSYLIEAFPTSFIIGKDGVIQSVHIGFDNDTKDKIKKEIDELLSGKPLIKNEK
ncbi:MAG: hypothetical protein A2X48_04740 [Lentisphaerae bacterium GWF2_49_21]|nr:MAG: hypothetical protein A2X48_04740 [Lentisphaerae bacterium GWF2_49_21]